MEKENSNYYLNIAEKYFSTSCNDNGFNNVIKTSKNYFNNVRLDYITFCYLLNFSIFLFNYEKVNSNVDNKVYYISLHKKEMYELIFECKQYLNEDYNSKDWNKLRFYKGIKNIIEKYSVILNNAFDVVKFENKEDLINYYIDLFNNFVDDGSIKKDKIYPMFDDLIGLDEAKRKVKEKIIDPILYKDIYSKYDISLGGGILLYGLPGTGKTMFAQAVANEIDAYFISIKSSDLKSKWFGDTENKVKELFEDARKHDISVVFFDEFESIGVSRDKRGAELTAETIVPELLAQMQGFEQNDQTVLVIAATNRPWDIDSALLRPGRFDSLICIELPDKKLRLKMFQKNLSSIKVEEDILEYLASATNNYNGADIKKISECLIRKVISKEIDNIKNYLITFEDCVEVLKSIKSSVSLQDMDKMYEFKNMEV